MTPTMNLVQSHLSDEWHSEPGSFVEAGFPWQHIGKATYPFFIPVGPRDTGNNSVMNVDNNATSQGCSSKHVAVEEKTDPMQKVNKTVRVSPSHTLVQVQTDSD
jgi:hypothetical protein